jgi:hypothetical protein
MSNQPAVFVEQIGDPSMLNYVEFMDGRAEIVVPGGLLRVMPFDVENFIEDDEYWEQVDAIRSRGYINAKPIVVWPSSDKRWIIDEDDAPRFMAAKHVANDFFSNLLREKVRKVRFLLHRKSADGRYSAPHLDLVYGGD